MGYFALSETDGVVRDHGELPRLPVHCCVECEWCFGGCGLRHIEFACSRPGMTPEPLFPQAMVRRCHEFSRRRT